MPGAHPLTGIGVDVCDPRRWRTMVARVGEDMLARVFTHQERVHLAGARGVCWDRVAGRFAAKEATRKIFGRYGVMPRLHDIHVGSGPHGQPLLTLHGAALRLARRYGIGELIVSIAHENTCAVAVVLAQPRRHRQPVRSRT